MFCTHDYVVDVGKVCNDVEHFVPYQVKTPGGRIVYIYIKKRGTVPKCGDCKTKLPGIKPSRPRERCTMSKRLKTVNRAYGGTRCHKCVRNRLWSWHGARRPKWLEREFTDRKVRGSNPPSATRLPLSRLGQPGGIPALVLPSGNMAARHRKGATAERFLSAILSFANADEPVGFYGPTHSAAPTI
ncbi:hypothetical protein T265_09386 [Opisthorchis viverrini]|uniref:Large ribosomal subunit protein eL34 n=1 Tax=Opisthorchis viverrini TaxID=6198 RepID=A0A074Z5Y5_OPIVI|nr:hypothetical protein T265_09386 [Opisthorchis viverrini]KER22556.1 hypothetical protein T265_09386 [Opisthorchis viverrini]